MKPQYLFWFVVVTLLSSGWAVLSTPVPKFALGDIVAFDIDVAAKKPDNFLFVEKTHCLPWHVSCTYDLARNPQYPLEHSDVNEAVLVNLLR